MSDDVLHIVPVVSQAMNLRWVAAELAHSLPGYYDMYDLYLRSIDQPLSGRLLAYQIEEAVADAFIQASGGKGVAGEKPGRTD